MPHVHVIRRLLAGLAATAIVAGAAVAAPASAADYGDPALRDRFPVAPGIERAIYSWQTIGGRQAVQVVRFRLDDSRVELRPELGGGVVPGREPVNRTVSRLGERAVAGVNGGFWLGYPSGDPEGLVVRDGRYLSEPATQGVGPRAAFALFPNGGHAVGRPGYQGSVWLPSGRSARLSAINRLPRDNEVVAYTSAYASSTQTASGTVEVVFDGLDLDVATLTSATVSRVRGNNGPLTTGSTVLAGRGSWADELRRLRAGDRVTFDTRMTEDWRGATQALAAGPLILQDGQITDSRSWEVEGFHGQLHNNTAHPRTVVGFTADREMMLVTIDGRQGSYSHGVTTQETADLMRRLGAVDAVMMDGGGSTTMVTDGRVENRPSDGNARHVSNSLVVYSNARTPDVTRLQGASRWATAAATALRGWPNGTGQAVIASGLDFPDGLAGGPLAAKADAPLLLTLPDRLPAETVDALRRMRVEHVAILGGTAVVSDTVADQLRGMGIAVSRVAGAGRAATAAEIARRVGAPNGRAVLASGGGFADALSATVPAAAAKAPLLLTASDTLSPETADALTKLRVREVVVVGGRAVVSDQVVRDLQSRGFAVTRVAGKDRYTTSAEIVRWAERNAGFRPQGVAVASGRDFPDALAGGPFGARQQVPVLLTHTYDLYRSPATAEWIEQHQVDRAFILGGRLAVATWVGHLLQQAHDR